MEAQLSDLELTQTLRQTLCRGIRQRSAIMLSLAVFLSAVDTVACRPDPSRTEGLTPSTASTVADSPGWKPSQELREAVIQRSADAGIHTQMPCHNLGQG